MKENWELNISVVTEAAAFQIHQDFHISSPIPGVTLVTEHAAYLGSVERHLLFWIWMSVIVMQAC